MTYVFAQMLAMLAGIILAFIISTIPLWAIYAAILDKTRVVKIVAQILFSEFVIGVLIIIVAFILSANYLAGVLY